MRDVIKRTHSGLQEHLERTKARPRDYMPKAHVPPPSDIWTRIRDVEKSAGTLPLSLRAFYEVVGSVDFMGFHPRLAHDAESDEPSENEVMSDPLVVLPLCEEVVEQDEEDNGASPRIALAPDSYHKAQYSGGAGYSILLPCSGADAIVEDEPHKTYFVDYLRIVFAWGGFPGFEG